LKPQTKHKDKFAEYLRFLQQFGKEKAGEYFSAGLTFEQALVRHCAEQKDQIERQQVLIEFYQGKL
jgi:hypothetical protein